MLSRLFQLGLTIITIPILSVSAFGCYCAGKTPCEAFGSASAVFVGTAQASRIVRRTREDDPTKIWQEMTFTFSVEQSFLGVDGPEVEVSTGMGSCSYPFQTGQRYLVYAQQDETNRDLFTSSCTRTTRYSEADEDVKYLARLHSQAPGVAISGDVKEPPTSQEGTDAQAEGSVTRFALTIEGASEKREIRTDEQGNFRVTGLAPGKYEVTVLLPDELTVYEPKRKLSIADRGCAIVKYYLRENGRISGRALDPEGQPGVDVAVAIFDVNGAAIGRGFSTHVRTDEKGLFSFSELPPGRYLLGVNATKDSRADEVTNKFPRSYYPGVADAASATLITVGAGEKVGDLNLRLLPRRLPRRVSIKVLGIDGKPFAKARIRFRDATYYDSSITATHADEQGCLVINAYEGQTLAIEATHVPDGPNGFVISGFGVPDLVAPTRVVVDSQTEQVEIVINKPK